MNTDSNVEINYYLKHIGAECSSELIPTEYVLWYLIKRFPRDEIRELPVISYTGRGWCVAGEREGRTRLSKTIGLFIRAPRNSEKTSEFFEETLFETPHEANVFFMSLIPDNLEFNVKGIKYPNFHRLFYEHRIEILNAQSKNESHEDELNS